MSAADDLVRLSADLDALDRSLRAAETNLIDIDDAWNALSAVTPPMTGAGADRLQELHDRISGLWEHWTALQSVLRRARDVADAGDARALAALLERDSVLVTGQRLALAQRTLTGGFRNEARYRPAQLLDDMSTTFADTRDKLDVLAALRRDVDSRAAKVHADLDALQRGIDGEQPDQAELAAVQLAVLAVDGAATDPIGADAALVDAIVRIDALRTALHERHLQRGGLADHLAAAARAAGELQARVQALLVDSQRMAAAYVGADRARADIEVAQRSARQLTSRLAELAARDVSAWRATVADLARWQREHDRLAAGLDAAARSLSAPADRRAELRGLLDATKAKARERGCGEVAPLTALADEALRLLRTVPADLDVAARAVAAYVEALRAQLSEGARQ
jgi:hypothetical protein